LNSSKTSGLRYFGALLVLLLLAAILFFVIAEWRAAPSEPENDRPVVPRAASSALNDGSEETARSRLDVSPFFFTDVVADSGVIFEYYGGPSVDAHMTEQNGGGVALLDFDHDGTLDLFLVNGSRFDQPASEVGETSRLFRANGNLKYSDVTQISGMESYGFGMGTCAGDFDNDGFVDLFIACYGRNRLWRNDGDGTFSEVTDSTGVGDNSWGTSAAFADLDNDGLLDLYVVNYVEWVPTDEPCTIEKNSKIKIVCSPMDRPGQTDLLMRNHGDGRFKNVESEAGIDVAEFGKGLALSVADFNSDGLLDIYVVNDTTKNFMFMNNADMSFEESAIAAGVAMSSDGTQGSGMGVANADYDRNGSLDLCVSNFQNQTNDLYANLGTTGFITVNKETGLDLITRPKLGFGILFADFDLDRWPDIFVANGHIWDKTTVIPQFEYRMRPTIIRNFSGRRFKVLSQDAGAYFSKRWLARAVAVGDLDNDGDPDLVVQHLAAQPAILRNDQSQVASGVLIELIGITSARQPLGASINVVQDGVQMTLRVPSGDSFQASHDYRVLVASRGESAVDEIQVTWSSGNREVWRDVVPEGRLIRLIEGRGERQTPATMR
jgi:enediyne biosynthesis protein E4